MRDDEVAIFESGAIVLRIAERAGKLIATTVSFADSITGDRCSPNVFRVNARAGQQSAALAVWLWFIVTLGRDFFRQRRAEYPSLSNAGLAADAAHLRVADHRP